jgi:hypothetical protein
MTLKGSWGLCLPLILWTDTFKLRALAPCLYPFSCPCWATAGGLGDTALTLGVRKAT